MDYRNTKTPSMHHRLDGATLSQLAFPRKSNPNFPWEKSQWDNTVIKVTVKCEGRGFRRKCLNKDGFSSHWFHQHSDDVFSERPVGTWLPTMTNSGCCGRHHPWPHSTKSSLTSCRDDACRRYNPSMISLKRWAPGWRPVRLQNVNHVMVSPTSGLHLGWFEVLRSLRHYLQAQGQGHHAIDVWRREV